VFFFKKNYEVKSIKTILEKKTIYKIKRKKAMQGNIIVIHNVLNKKTT
jgi:hypothetical protein